MPQNNAPKEKGSPTDYDSYWDASGVKGAPRVVIDLGKEQAFFYKGKTLVGLSRISPGREGFDSPTGNFKITQKSPNHRSNLFGNYVDRQGNVVKEDVDVRRDKPPAGARFEGSPMPYFMRFHGAVGMHAGYLPGYPASHGCIRMPEEMARHFFNNVSKGTPVQVVKSVEASASPRVRRARSAYGG